MSGRSCPCEFRGGPAVWSADWHAEHAVHHLGVFPDVDQATRDNLRLFTEWARKKETADANT